MSVPGALAVYSARIVSALRLKSDGMTNGGLRRELRALAKHPEVGRARFDMCRSAKLNLLRKKPMKVTLTTYDSANVELMKELEIYYMEQLENGITNSRSTVWVELVSASVAMREFIFLETRVGK